MNAMNSAGTPTYDHYQPMPPYQPMPSAHSDMPSVGISRDFKIRRVGARPLVFRGTELAMCMSFTPDLPYWYEMNIYRTDQQRFVLAIRLFSQSETEKDHVRAWEADAIGNIFDLIETYDAAQDVRLNLPENIASAPAAELAAHALDLAAKVASARAHFAGLVGELFAEIDAATV